MESQQEQQLLEEIRNGMRESFAILIEPHIPKAYRTALAILHSTHLAEEAVQNAMIEAYHSIKSDKEIRNFGGWFSRVIAYRALDLLRKEIKNTNLDIESVVLHDLSSSPLDTYIYKERTDKIREMVMSMDIKHRTVIVLYYFQEMSIEEIANLLQVTKGTVKTRLHRARVQLSKIVSYPEINTRVVQI